MSKIRILNLLSCLAIGIGAGSFLGGNSDGFVVCLMCSCLANVWAFILLPHELYLTKNELMDEMSFYRRENDALFNRYDEFQDQLESVNHKINKIVVESPKNRNRVKTARKV